MASKTLIRTGASLLNRFLSNPFLHQKPNCSKHIVPHGIELSPEFFPAVTKFPSILQHPLNDGGSVKKIASEEILYPCGLPSLRFFFPDVSLSDEPMLLFPKRTFQPSLIRRKRNHGFFARKATRGGRRVIARRIAKGRSRITA